MIPFLRNIFRKPAPDVPRERRASRQPQPVAAAAPTVTPVRHYFEALNVVDHRTPIPATGLYVHRLLSKFNRLQLASVARYLWDNVGLVFYATDQPGWRSTRKVKWPSGLWQNRANLKHSEILPEPASARTG